MSSHHAFSFLVYLTHCSCTAGSLCEISHNEFVSLKYNVCEYFVLLGCSNMQVKATAQLLCPVPAPISVYFSAYYCKTFNVRALSLFPYSYQLEYPRTDKIQLHRLFLLIVCLVVALCSMALIWDQEFIPVVKASYHPLVEGHYGMMSYLLFLLFS